MNAELRENELCWYLLYTQARQEDRAEGNLKTFNIEVFAPRFKQRRYNSFTGDVSHIVKPLFPNYLFARFNVRDLYHKVRFTRGVRHLVSCDNRPSVVEDEVVALIRSRMGQDGLVAIGERLETGERLEIGDEIVIKSGPFKNMMGVLEREMKDSERVMVLLNAVSYQAYLVVDTDIVQKRNTSGPTV